MRLFVGQGLVATACAVLFLGGCRDEAPAPQPQPDAQQNASQVEARPVSGPEVAILAFGDSLFAGYNVDEGEGYPAVLEDELRRRGINARVIDAAVSGNTTGAGVQRIAFALDNQPEPLALAIVELGGNDLLRGIPPAETRANLEQILAEIDERGIPILLMGMRAPPNLGADYVAEFDSIYSALAERYDAELVPFFLEAVYQRAELIQPDRIHPTAEGIEELVAATVDDVAAALPDDDSAG